MHCVVFEITDGRSVGHGARRAVEGQRVVLAQPLQEFHTLTVGRALPSTTIRSTTCRPICRRSASPRAHERAQGAGVRVALIDTGVDAAHPDLSGRIVRTHSFLSAAAPPAAALRATAPRWPA